LRTGRTAAPSLHAGRPASLLATQAARHRVSPQGLRPALGPAGRRPAAIAAASGGANARDFVARRDFAGSTTFRRFANRAWTGRHHLGWVGPLFWPYGYGDVFYYSLWPYEYGDVDPFWAYGYNDIYEGIFSPYSYDQYVEGPQVQTRMTALTQGMTDACASEAAEVTSWPIDQIQQVLQPNDQQRTLLDDLGNAIVKASGAIKSNCPASVALDRPSRRHEGAPASVDRGGEYRQSAARQIL
jgi:hypothetical protein